ncbi:hypothetical protein, partial [Neisseria meningitidis]|uniref:hypothetical protein n=1 Tax=Neisseria meningitidis TaxID=487 RepID=UPI001C57B735
RGNDEVEVTRNLKQAKPNELDSHFRGNDRMQVRGNDEFQVSAFSNKCPQPKIRHSRVGGNLDIQC